MVNTQNKVLFLTGFEKTGITTVAKALASLMEVNNLKGDVVEPDSVVKSIAAEMTGYTPDELDVMKAQKTKLSFGKNTETVEELFASIEDSIKKESGNDFIAKVMLSKTKHSDANLKVMTVFDLASYNKMKANFRHAELVFVNPFGFGIDDLSPKNEEVLNLVNSVIAKKQNLNIVPNIKNNPQVVLDGIKNVLTSISDLKLPRNIDMKKFVADEKAKYAPKAQPSANTAKTAKADNKTDNSKTTDSKTTSTSK